MAALQYRPAIDGLRAIAVLSVFIFHLNHRWLPGGFTGVDVFRLPSSAPFLLISDL
jgi:peptidoglycan/LPS O-acetylase OafA/YrhL